MQQYIFISLLLVSCYSCAKLPPSFKRCDRTQDNFQECLREAIQDAIQQLKEPFPSVGLSTLDPLIMPSLTISAGSGAVGFDQNYKDCKGFGLSTLHFNKIDMDFEKKTLLMVAHAPQLEKICHYSFNGKIMLLPIKGSGISNITMVNLDATLRFQFSEIEKKGKKYFHIDDSVLTFNPSRIYFNLTNLFDGNEQLGKNINQVLNDNWSEVFKDVQSGYEKAFAIVYKEFANNVFSRVSISDLFGSV